MEAKNLDMKDHRGFIDASVSGGLDSYLGEYLSEVAIKTEAIDHLEALERPIGLITDLYVGERMRHQGYGKAIMEETMARIAAAGAEDIVLLADTEQRNDFDLVAWYKRLGFEIVDTCEYAPLMVRGAPELIADLRAIHGVTEPDSAPSL